MSEAFSFTACVSTALMRPDDGRVVFALEQVGLFGQILREVREVGGFLDAFGRLHGVVAGFVSLRAAASRTWLLQPSRDAAGCRGICAPRRRPAAPRLAIHALGDALVDALHEHSVALGEGEADALRTNDLGRGDLVHGLGGVPSRSARVAAKPVASRATSRPGS